VNHGERPLRRREVLTSLAWSGLASLTLGSSRTDARQAPAPGRRTELIDAVAAAAGGAERLAAVSDLVIAGSIVLSGGQGNQRGDLVTEILYPDRIRVSLSLTAGQIVQGYDGRTAWLRAGGALVDLPPTMADEMRRLVLVTGTVGLLREASLGRIELEAERTDRLLGRSVDVLTWRLGKDRITLSVDREAHVLAGAEYVAYSPQGTAAVEVRWRDYREAGSLRLPWKATTLRNRLEYSDTTTKHVAINVGLDPGAFVRP
jgi:hypothetical protein